MAQYSFKGSTGVIAHPIAGTFLFQGQIGLGQITFSKETTRAVNNTTSDGYVLTNFIIGNSGKIMIETIQTGALHSYLLGMSNDIDTALTNGDLTNALTAVLSFKAQDGSLHEAFGVTIEKQPDKVYAAQGANITWTLLCNSLIQQ